MCILHLVGKSLFRHFFAFVCILPLCGAKLNCGGKRMALSGYVAPSPLEVYNQKKTVLLNFCGVVDVVDEIISFATCGRPLPWVPLNPDGSVSEYYYCRLYDPWASAFNGPTVQVMSYKKWEHFKLLGPDHECNEYWPMSFVCKKVFFIEKN